MPEKTLFDDILEDEAAPPSVFDDILEDEDEDDVFSDILAEPTEPLEPITEAPQVQEPPEPNRMRFATGPELDKIAEESKDPITQGNAVEEINLRRGGAERVRTAQEVSEGLVEIPDQDTAELSQFGQEEGSLINALVVVRGDEAARQAAVEGIPTSPPKHPMGLAADGAIEAALAAGEITLDFAHELYAAGEEVLSAGEELFLAVRGERFGFDKPATDKLEEIGLFPRADESLLQSPVKHINKAVANFTTASLETVIGGVGALFEGGIEAVDQVRIATGGDPRDSGLKRELGAFVDFMLISLGMGPILTGARIAGASGKAARAGSAIKKAQRELNIVDNTLEDTRALVLAAQRQVDELKKLSPLQKVSVKEAIKEKFNAAAGAVVKAEARVAELTRPRARAFDDVDSKFAQKLFVNVVDQMGKIEILARRGAREAGIPVDLTVTRDAHLFAGLPEMNRFIVDRGTLRLNELGEFVPNGIGIREALKRVAVSNEKMDRLADHMIGLRARDLTRRDPPIEVPFSEEEIARRIAIGADSRAIQETVKDFRGVNFRQLDLLQQSGVTNAKSTKALKDAGENYVPFNRILTELDAEGNLIERTSKLRFRNPLRNIKGDAELPLGDFFDNLLSNQLAITRMAVSNLTQVKIVEMVEKFRMTNIAHRVKGNIELVKLADAKSEAALIKLGLKEPGDLVKVFSPHFPQGDRLVQIFRNGEREIWKVDDVDLWKSFLGFQPRSMGWVNKMFAFPANVFRRTVTASPAFMSMNAPRDIQTAMLFSKAGQIPVVDFLRGLKKTIMQDDDWWLMLANGGGFSHLSSEGGAFRKSTEAFYSSKGLRPESILNTGQKFVRALEAVGATVESGSRTIEGSKLIAQGANLRDAAIGYSRVSVDFRVRGASPIVQAFLSTIPFANATIQGLKSLVQVARADPRQFAIRGAVGIMGPTIALWAINKDNPKYQQLPDWRKRQFWAIPMPDDTTDANGNPIDFVYLPKGFEVGAIFGAIPEIILDAIDNGYGPRTASAFANLFANTLVANPIPQIIKPVAMAGDPFGDFMGLNLKFSGAPVVSGSKQKLQRSDQFTPWTSTTMVELAEIMSEELGIEMSPLKAQEIFQGYLGLLGAHALAVSDIIIESIQGKDRSFNRLDEVEFFKRFVSQGRDSEFVTRFYDMLTESRMIAASVATQKKYFEFRTLKGLNEMERQLQDDSFRRLLDKIADKINTIQDERNIAMRVEKNQRRLSGIINDSQEAINELVYEFARGLSPELSKKFGFPPTPGPFRKEPSVTVRFPLIDDEPSVFDDIIKEGEGQ